MRKWATLLSRVTEEEHENGLSKFKCEQPNGAIGEEWFLYGYIIPKSKEQQEEIIMRLTNGGCPIAEGWDSGTPGGQCTIWGWHNEDQQ